MREREEIYVSIHNIISPSWAPQPHTFFYVCTSIHKYTWLDVKYTFEERMERRVSEMRAFSSILQITFSFCLRSALSFPFLSIFFFFSIFFSMLRLFFFHFFFSPRNGCLDCFFSSFIFSLCSRLVSYQPAWRRKITRN